MNNTPIISVIVPVYNVEKYLSKCIDSILIQTFTDFELLLIDDGTPDRSGEICDAYAKLDHRIRVFHQLNSGLSASRNVGIDNAKGEYIVFIDSDDYVEKNYLYNLYQLLPHAISGMGFVVQGYKKCAENGSIIKATQFQSHFYLSNDIDTFFAEESDIWGIFGACAKLFQRNFLNKYSIRFDAKTRFTEDIPFILECMRQCDYIMIGNSLDYCYINHSGTLSTSIHAFDVLYYSFKLCEQAMHDIVGKYKFSLLGKSVLFRNIEFIFSTLLKADYHYLKETPRHKRLSDLSRIRDYHSEYLNSYYFPDYLVDKLGRFLIIHGFFRCYDMLFVILTKMNFKRMYAPPTKK